MGGSRRFSSGITDDDMDSKTKIDFAFEWLPVDRPVRSMRPLRLRMEEALGQVGMVTGGECSDNRDGRRFYNIDAALEANP